MKLVQKILSHGLLIAFVVAAFFIITNRAELFPQWFAKPQASVDKAVSEKSAAPVVPPASTVTRPLPEKTLVKKEGRSVEPAAPAGDASGGGAIAPTPAVPPVAETRSEAPSAPAEPTTPPVADTVTSPVETAPATAAEESSAAPVVTPPAAEVPAGAESAAVAESAEEAGAVSAWQQPAAGATAEPSTYRPLGEASPADVAAPAGAAAPVEVPATESAEPAATPASSAAAVQVPVQPEETAAVSGAVESQASAGDEQLAQQLEEVRALYWARDLRGAAAGYKSLGQAYPDNADVWGEIGNFYYSLRQAGPATTAYSRAIELLVQQGDKPRARQLLDVLYQLDASAARELEMRLQQTGS